nr:hypothetical protein Iba_chr12dCG13300 [Ipomoea batatas]
MKLIGRGSAPEVKKHYRNRSMVPIKSYPHARLLFQFGKKAQIRSVLITNCLHTSIKQIEYRTTEVRMNGKRQTALNCQINNLYIHADERKESLQRQCIEAAKLGT